MDRQPAIDAEVLRKEDTARLEDMSLAPISSAWWRLAYAPFATINRGS